MSEMINRLDFVYPMAIKRAVSGFSLLELVLVLFLMGTVMLTSLFLVDGADDQARYEETKNKLAMIKHAIVGDANRTLNGEPEITGFVADMGRLPVCIRELVDGKCVDSDPAPPLWVLNNASGLWAGWRGPYLNTSVGNDFRDGWGNKNTDAVEDASNFGWDFLKVTLLPRLPGVLTIKSFGKNGEIGGSSQDYTSDQEISISFNEHHIDLASWDVINVEFNNIGSLPITILANSLQLKLHTQTESENFYLSEPFPASDTVVPAVSQAFSVRVATSVGHKFKLPSTTTPAGTVSSVTVDVDGNLQRDSGAGYVSLFSLVGCPCVIELPANTTLSGSELTIATAADLILPPSNIVPSKVNIPVNGLTKYVVIAPHRSSWDDTNSRLILPSGATVTFPADSNWDNNKIFSATSTINVSESFTLDGTEVETASGDIFFVPSGSTQTANTITLTKNLPLPIGISALSVVCVSNNAIYTGENCPADPLAVSDSTYKFKLAPRHAAPLKPNPFIWTIE